MSSSPVGVFDSGVGGLSVLRELRRQLPDEAFLYVADQAHVPHGQRSLEEVRGFSFGMAEFLIARGAKLIVVACNTDSAAALQPLRQRHPEIPFVGMEPAVKPAAEASRSGVIGVIATQATFQSELFASLVDRFAHGVRVITQTCPGLVERVEAGEVAGPALESYLQTHLDPLKRGGIDELVLGCTHYPFVRAAIAEVMGPGVKIVDPAPAVAAQVRRILEQKNLLSKPGSGGIRYFTSGDPAALARTILALLGESAAPLAARWHEGSLSADPARSG